MKRFFFLLAGFVLCASASAQTVKPLAYNLTNGIVMVTTNVTWSNSFKFSTNTVAAQVRTNLGLGWSALTNTNAANFRSAIGLGQGSTVEFDTFSALSRLYIGNSSNYYISLADDVAEFVVPIAALNASGIQFTLTNSSASATRTNLGLGWSALTNTNAANFQSVLFSTNAAPTNTTNAAAWVTLQVGTNTYRLPCYQ